MPVEVLESDRYVAIFNNWCEAQDLNLNFERLLRLKNGGLSLQQRVMMIVILFYAIFRQKLGLEKMQQLVLFFCSVAPYWSRRLDKQAMLGVQLSERRSSVQCRVEGENVFLRGEAALYMQGEIILKEA